jgi:2-haloacid dehalogenase
MNSNRREFFSSAAIAGLALRGLGSPTAAPGGRIKAVAFDAFPILDPRPIFKLVNELYPAKGNELSTLWRNRQFGYTWLRTMSQRYSDFGQITNDALVFAAKSLNLPLTPETHARLMQTYLKLQCWPDVPSALRSLKDAGIRLALLSNMTVKMLESGLRNSGLEPAFDYLLSTDRVKAYKPDPRAYQMGVDAFGLKPSEILFGAFAGWDAAGAKAFGYPTYWVNRQNQPAEELGIEPDLTGSTLTDLAAYLAA